MEGYGDTSHMEEDREATMHEWCMGLRVQVLGCAKDAATAVDRQLIKVHSG